MPIVPVAMGGLVRGEEGGKEWRREGKGEKEDGGKVPVVPSSESSIHSWSWVYFFSRTVQAKRGRQLPVLRNGIKQ